MKRLILVALISVGVLYFAGLRITDYARGNWQNIENEEQKLVELKNNQDIFMEEFDQILEEIGDGLALSPAIDRVIEVANKYQPIYLAKLHLAEKYASCRERVGYNILRHFKCHNKDEEFIPIPGLVERLEKELTNLFPTS